MHVCAIPHYQAFNAGTQRRPAWSSSWRRWRRSSVAGLKDTVFLKNAVSAEQDDRTGRFASPIVSDGIPSASDSWISGVLTRFQTQDHPNSRKMYSQSFYADEKQLEEKSSIVEVSELEFAPLCENDEKFPSWGNECSSRKWSTKVQCTLGRLFRSRRRRHVTEGDRPMDSPQRPRKTRKAKKRRETQETPKTRMDSVENEQGSSLNSMAYHVAVGLAWHMPAPFDMMPQGYPSRLF